MGIDGIPAIYDEICSAKLVSGYVENFDSSLPDVVCTSPRYMCQYFVALISACITCHMHNARSESAPQLQHTQFSSLPL